MGLARVLGKQFSIPGLSGHELVVVLLGMVVVHWTIRPGSA